jgi:hypothetical protein
VRIQGGGTTSTPADFSRLEMTLRDLRACFEAPEIDEDAKFRAIFATNVEIGRVAKMKRELKPQLVEMQSCLNRMTVGLKANWNDELIRSALERTQEIYVKITEEKDDERGAPSQKEFIASAGRETG